MDLLGASRRGVDGILHPNGNTKSMTLREALAFYYNAAIIPLIIAIVAGLAAYFASGGALSGSTNTAFTFFRLFNGLGAASAVAIPLFYILVLTPVGIVVSSAVYQLFAKRLFKLWKGDISKTATAIVYAQMVQLMLFWLYIIGIELASYYLYMLIVAVMAIWGIVVLVMSLSKQQNISGMRALGSIILVGVILGIIAVVITVGVVLALVSTGYTNTSSHLESFCIAGSGFTCGTPSLSTLGTLKFVFGQDSGRTFYNTVLSVASINATISNTTGFPVNRTTYYIGTLQSGQKVNVAMPANYPPLPQVCSVCSKPLNPGDTFVGDVWINYTITPAGPANIVGRAASLFLKAS